MNMKKRKRSKSKIYIVAGFLLLYISGMILSTVLVKEQSHYLGLTAASEVNQIMINNIQDVELIYNEDGTLSDYSRDYLQYILSDKTHYLNQYVQYSSGLLDAEGNLIAETSDSFYESAPHYMNNEPVFNLIDMEEYFTEEEIALFREYFIVEKQKTYPKLDDGYGAKVSYDSEKDQLVHFYIFESEEKKTEDGAIQEVFADTPIFEWQNPDYAGSELHHWSFKAEITYYMIFPYAQYGEKYWARWKNDEELHDYFAGTDSEHLTEDYLNRDYGKYETTYINRIYLGDNSEKNYEKPDYILVTNVKTDPWGAAISKLKEMYLYAACFVAVCMAIVLYLVDRAEKQQMQLEQTRRDFTNAVAHELKTPIAIIRSIFENMEREKSEEKNEHYRQQGVCQTERMDDLIKEMIFISKMDAADMKLKMEEVSVLSLIEEQMNKIEPLMEEKNLHIELWKEDDFLIQGDRIYLEKAFFNILENAAAYNRQDGTIAVHICKDSCVIENTGDPIPEEDLPKVYDLFFTSNKSRKSEVGHKGLGLYLAKRIFEMHKREIKVENTEVGVKVTVR